MYGINRYGANVNGERCYLRLKDLPKTVEGVVIVVPPKETEHIVKEAAEMGIRRVWMQQGSESRAAVQFCEQYGLDAIYGKCIFMFAEPVISFHKFHKWLMKVLHKLPK